MTKRKKAKAASKAHKAKAKAPASKRPDGSISSGIYDAVQKLTANGTMKRSEAFRQIAKNSGRNANTVAVNYYYAAKKRGGTKRSATTTAGAKAAKATKAAAPKKAGVSAMIFDAIQKLIARGKMTRAAAFRQHAKQTGRNEGTVSVNYYYAAKKRGVRKRGPGRPKMAAGARNGAGSARLEAVLKSLADLIRAQDTELAALRRDGQRFAELRRLIG